MELYRKKIELWKREQVRQYEEFIIEENELQDRLVSRLIAKLVKCLEMFMALKYLDLFAQIETNRQFK
jgi:hypothetical protein